MSTLSNKIQSKIEDRYSFDDSRHCHMLDGKPLIGVTTCLGIIAKPALVPWAVKLAVEYMENWLESDSPYESRAEALANAKKAHTEKKDTAGTFGKNVHKACEEWIKEGKNPEGLDEKEQKAFDNFKSWAETHNVKFLESEINVWSEEMWTGGICDLVLEIDGKKYIGDIKTSSAIYPEHFIQCSAYSEMLKDRYPDVHGMVIINLQKTGKLDHKFNYEVKENFEAFKAALHLYKFLKNEKK